MLVTLAEMKAYLGITVADYDTFLTEQITLISDTIEVYVGRKLLSSTVVQTYYGDDYDVAERKKLPLYQYPVSSITTIKLNGVDVTSSIEYRLDKLSGYLLSPTYQLFYGYDTLEVTYVAGYSSTPSPIKDSVYSLVAERYNKKVSGVALNFGSDVQRISIPGTISIDFDYSLKSNERTNAFGTILGNQANILDKYRGERSVLGGGSVVYVS
jgi:hypothetical protein